MRRTPPKVATHHFQPSGTTDGHPTKPVEFCAVCRYPQKNRRHLVEETSDEQRALEARRLGETSE